MMQNSVLLRQAARQLQHRLASHVATPSRQVLARARRKGSKLAEERSELKAVPTVTKLEWQRPLEIVKYPHPSLRAVNAMVGVFDESLVQLAREMFDVMYEEPGVGLAAPQVGVNIRMMVFNETADRNTGQEYILVNPEIVRKGKVMLRAEEGCLSFPNINGDVPRAQEIVVRAKNERGEDIELQLSEWPARIFQHEYDHLQGVLFHDRFVAGHLDRERAKLVQLEEQFLQLYPGTKIQRVPPPAPATPVKRGFS